MCLVPCMRKTCKGKVQSACCLMNVFPFLSLLVMCFQKTTMWKVGAFYLVFQISFYLLVLIEYISNLNGKLNFVLNSRFLYCVSLFIKNTSSQNCKFQGYEIHSVLNRNFYGFQNLYKSQNISCSVLYGKMIQYCFFFLISKEKAFCCSFRTQCMNLTHFSYQSDFVFSVGNVQYYILSNPLVCFK